MNKKMSTRMLSNNQEILVDFLNTHLAMVAFLMPWKRVTTTVATVEHHSLWSLFDMLNVDQWMIATGKTDDSLETKTHTFIGLVVTLLVCCIISFGSSVFYPNESGIRFGLDFINFSLGTVLLILAITFQGDFDAYWKHAAGGDPKVDYEQMFLVVGVLAGQIFLSLVGLGDKFKDVYNKYF